MATLVITLPSTDAAQSTPCEHVLSTDGTQVSRAGTSTLALLPASAGAEVVVVVPVQKLSWHLLALPKGILNGLGRSNAPRLRSVLEGLLEETLLDEPARLHFAIEPGASEGAPVRVAVCDRSWLNGWVAALELAGVQVARIVPEMAPATHMAGAPPPALQVIGTPEQPELVHTTADGIALLPLSAAAAVMFNLSDTHNGPLPVVAEPGVAELAEQIFKHPVTLQTRAERAVAAARTPWDLAQFDLLRTRGTRTRKHITALSDTLLRAPRWRAARWAAALLVLVNLAGVQAWAWKEQNALAAKRVAIKDTLTATFPDVRVVVDAPLQMARALADLQRQSGTASGADLETMLGQFQAAAPAAPAPAAIEFIANELQLKGMDAAAPGLADVTTRLQARGYSARWDGDALIIRQETRP